MTFKIQINNIQYMHLKGSNTCAPKWINICGHFYEIF